MSIAEKLTTIAENEQKVYDKGFADGKAQGGDGVDWDIIQNYGKRTAYSGGFAAWAIKHLSPKYIVKPTTTTFANALQGCTELETVDWEKFDLSQVTSFYVTFNSCFKLKSIDTDLIPAATYASCWNNSFSGCWELKKIQKIKSFPEHTWINSFGRCDNLEEIRFTNDSVIANNISFADSPKLTRESIVSILEALANNLSATKTLTFNTELGFEGKMIDPVFGRFSDNVMETREGTINGIEYRLSSDEIYLNGTATDDVNINLWNTPIVFPEWNYDMSLQFTDEYGLIKDWLSCTIQKADGSINTLWAYNSGGSSVGAFSSGDKIISVDLTIPSGVTYDNALARVYLFIDYLYWILETRHINNCWHIVY